MSDCLVLKIEEYYTDTDELDTTMYVFYDKETHYFYIRGKRRSKNLDSVTFSFTCEFAEELVDFISFAICKKNKWTYVLYNYNNLPLSSDDISYEYLVQKQSKVNELAGYNKQDYKRKTLLSHLRMLRNVFNYYK
jgi:hypothetical protein